MNEIDRLFNDINRMAVGFGPLFRDITRTADNYPPHNIITVSENKFILELAVAGFKKNEISVQEHEGLLTITAEKNKDEDIAGAYQFKGLAKRSFSKSFRIAEYFEIAAASLEDGILTVEFVKNVPIEAKPKLIAIK